MAANTKVQVCSKALGVTKSGSGYLTQCAVYPSGTATYTPDMDPEASLGLLLHRVDVTYTITPLIPINFFGFNIVPPLSFHWDVEMRAIN